MAKVGRPLRFESVEEFDTLIEEYKVECAEKEEPYTIIGLSVFMGITKETLNQYSKQEKFSDSYKKAMDYAENSLVTNSLNGKYNSTVSIFLLKNNHHYTDKTEVKQDITADITQKVIWE